ncbi:putative Snf7 family protein [Helianthus debilis subsp. tardiflorus]
MLWSCCGLGYFIIKNALKNLVFFPNSTLTKAFNRSKHSKISFQSSNPSSSSSNSLPTDPSYQQSSSNHTLQMEKVMNILKPKPNPQQLLRDWQRRLRQECRNIDRQIREIQKEEKNVQKAIREAAKRNDMGSAKSLAKEIVRSRRTVNRLHENKAQLNSISMHLGESVAIARTVGHLSKSAEVMKLVNNLMKAPEMAVTMQEFNKEMTKAGVIEEIVNDAVDSALDSDDIEDEIDEEVDKVLTAIAGETAAQLPEAVRKERLKQPAQATEDAEDEGVDDEEELEEIRARLAKVRS